MLKITHTLFSLKGRTGRGPYWIWLIFMFVVHFIVGLWTYSSTSGMEEELQDTASKGASLMLNILLFWPSLAITIKRWHDVNKSGMWIFINLIPILGWIYSFIYNGFVEGNSNDNNFGAPNV